MESLHHLSQNASLSVINGVWQGIVLASAVALILRLVPRTTAAIRFAIWFAAFAVVAALPFLHLAPHPLAAQDGGTLLRLTPRSSLVLAVAWLGASLVRAGTLLLGAVRVRSLWKRAKPIAVLSIPAIARPKQEVRRAVVCTSAEIDRPCVIGFLSPRILIPAWLFEELGEQELHQIVLHETGHLRRADDWINLLQKIGLVLFPLNPALLWVERRLCFERELACDAAVLELTQAPKAYATCLTSLAEHRLARRGLALSLGALGRQSQLGRRVHSILQPRQHMGSAQTRFAAAAAAMVLLAGTAELARCPQLVSFTSPATIALADQPAAGFAPPRSLYTPVAFQPSSRPHVNLLKVSEPMASAPATPAKRRSTHPGAAPVEPRPISRLVRAAVPEQPQPRQWVIFTAWQDSDGPRMVLTTFQQISRQTPTDPQAERQAAPPADQVFPYTAIPVRGGWLVIQL